MENQSYIEVKLNPKGKYYWSIHIGFGLEAMSTITLIKNIDENLKKEFPNNASVSPMKSSRVHTFEDEE